MLKGTRLYHNWAGINPQSARRKSAWSVCFVGPPALGQPVSHWNSGWPEPRVPETEIFHSASDRSFDAIIAEMDRLRIGAQLEVIADPVNSNGGEAPFAILAPDCAYPIDHSSLLDWSASVTR